MSYEFSQNCFNSKSNMIRRLKHAIVTQLNSHWAYFRAVFQTFKSNESKCPIGGALFRY